MVTIHTTSVSASVQTSDTPALAFTCPPHKHTKNRTLTIACGEEQPVLAQPRHLNVVHAIDAIADALCLDDKIRDGLCDDEVYAWRKHGALKRAEGHSQFACTGGGSRREGGQVETSESCKAY